LMIKICLCWCFFFFFQAEDGIRDRTVTGVQTCALPISISSRPRMPAQAGTAIRRRVEKTISWTHRKQMPTRTRCASSDRGRGGRSEERRVGKECRCWGWTGECRRREAECIRGERYTYEK